MSYDYSGPRVLTEDLPLVCDGDWHELDLDRFVPPLGEKVAVHVYVNVQSGYEVDPEPVDAKLECPNCRTVFDSTIEMPGVGRLRIKMRREEHDGKSVDDTYFYDLPLQRGMSWLDSRVMFELAEKNRGQHWEYRVTNAQGVVLGTRYVKESTDLGQVSL